MLESNYVLWLAPRAGQVVPMEPGQRIPVVPGGYEPRYFSSEESLLSHITGGGTEGRPFVVCKLLKLALDVVSL